MTSSYTIVVLTLLSTLTYYIYTRFQTSSAAASFCASHGCLLAKPMPQSERIIGLGALRALRRADKANTAMQFFSDLLTAHGPTFSVVVLAQELLITSNAENIKTMLASNFEDWGIGHREVFFSPLLGRGIFVSDGQAWHHSRALVRPAFTRTQVADLNLFESHLRPLLDKIPLGGTTIDLSPLFFRLTADVAFDFLFGDSSQHATPSQRKRRQDVGVAFDYAQSRLGRTGNYGRLQYFFLWNKFFRSCRFVHAYFDEYVNDALLRATPTSEESSLPIDKEVQEKGEKSERYVFLDELVKVTRDPVRIRSELLNILLAGRDTTASLLTTAFHALVRQPEVMKKLRSEVDELDGSLPVFETLREMRYLRHFLNECLRLWPIVPVNSRTSNKDTILPSGGGLDGKSPVYIPKGRGVTYSVYAMHRDKSVYGDDANDFRPERWDEIRPGWRYLPFNGG